MGGAFKQRDNDDGAFVTERIPMLPLGMYSDGKARVAWPGMLYEPYAAIRDYMTAPGDAMSPEIREKGARAGSYAAELGGTGGLATAGMRPGLGIFGGRNAKTADLAALKRAETKAAQGVDREGIWQSEGWFQGPDGKWRFEIDDGGARYTPDTDLPTVGDVFRHDLVFSAYPDLKKIAYKRDNEASWQGDRAFDGQFDEGTITIHDELGATGGKRTMLHELQHATQDKEGFAVGGNPSQFYPEDLYNKISDADHRQDTLLGQSWRAPTPEERAKLRSLSDDAGREKADLRKQASEWKFDQYRRLAGEAEARAVQKRMDMTPEARRARPPWLDYDVPENEQIVRFDDTPAGAFMASADNADLLARNSAGDMLKLRAGYRPPSKPQRPFDDDYAAPPGDPGSRLETTIDGDPLTARYVAGRRTVGGDDVGLSPEDTESAARALFTVNSVDPSLMPAKGAFGSFSPSRSEIRYRNDLDPEQTDIVVAHELGHGLDGGIVDNTGQVRPLRKVYHDLATADTRITKPKQMMGPEQYGYPANQVDGEMTAEAIRAYLQDPNYFKSVAPEMARRIREAVNTDPRLRDVIQFNANPSTAAGAFMMTPPAGAFDSTNDDPYGPDFLERGA